MGGNISFMLRVRNGGYEDFVGRRFIFLWEKFRYMDLYFDFDSFFYELEN